MRTKYSLAISRLFESVSSRFRPAPLRLPPQLPICFRRFTGELFALGMAGTAASQHRPDFASEVDFIPLRAKHLAATRRRQDCEFERQRPLVETQQYERVDG
jgi:hypothetical protein